MKKKKIIDTTVIKISKTSGSQFPIVDNFNFLVVNTKNLHSQIIVQHTSILALGEWEMDGMEM